MRRRRPARPGVTAAATTAVFATGDGPGLTAFATTAVLATGWPMTPTRPTRAALMGISGSYGRRCGIGLNRGDDRLNWDTSVGDELSAGPACRGCERRRPQVLPDQHASGASRLHRSGEVLDVVRGQQLSQLGLEGRQLAELVDVGEFGGLDHTVFGFRENQDVDDADGPAVDQRDELFCHLTGEVARPCRKFDDDVVNRAQFI